VLTPQDINSVDDAKRIVSERNLSHVKIGLFDIDGVMRGKYLRKEKFFAALDKGLAFCDVVLGWDSGDQLYEGVGVEYTGWHTGYPDAPVQVVPGSCRDIPFEPGMLLFLCEFAWRRRGTLPTQRAGPHPRARRRHGLHRSCCF
jgi:glutamine synthetase